jgi:hypothetical protein
LAWADGHHLWLWIQEKWVDRASEQGFRRANLLQKWSMQSLPFATLQLSFGLLAESLSSLMLVRRFRRPVLLALAGMHLGILATMQIAFLNNVYLLLALGLPIAELVDRCLAPRRTLTAPLRAGSERPDQAALWHPTVAVAVGVDDVFQRAVQDHAAHRV